MLQPVSELVHGHRQMRGELFVAGVGVVVILRQQVDVMQEDAAPVFIPEGLPHPHVQQLGSVKSAIPPLKKPRQALTHRSVYPVENTQSVCYVCT